MIHTIPTHRNGTHPDPQAVFLDPPQIGVCHAAAGSAVPTGVWVALGVVLCGLGSLGVWALAWLVARRLGVL